MRFDVISEVFLFSRWQNITFTKHHRARLGLIDRPSAIKSPLYELSPRLIAEFRTKIQGFSPKKLNEF